MSVMVQQKQQTDILLASSASNDPVLHFIMFVPSASHRPLHILDTSGAATLSSGFILPQWGGITLYNPTSDTAANVYMSAPNLQHTFSTFKRQLSALLGIPELPTGIFSLDDSSASSPWQLDALLRRRAFENVQDSSDTLQSIIKLVDQIGNMPVKQDVRGDIQESLTAFEMVIHFCFFTFTMLISHHKAYKAAPTSADLALLHSSRALSFASRAFFNPGMLALLYFPPEHTAAVYAPLFAPISLPLLAPLVRELMAWLKAKKAARKQKVE